MLDSVIRDMMSEAGWNQATQIEVLSNFINDELGAVKDLKGDIRKRIEEENELGRDPSDPEGFEDAGN